MSRLVRLHPRPWRDRYEEEVLDLLDQRAFSLADRIDLVRGAIDAHVHPQLPASRSPVQPLTHRVPGLLALAASLLWTANVTILLVWGNPALDWGLIGMAFVLMLVSLPGDYMLAGHGRRIALGLCAVAVCFVGFAAIPLWPVQLACAAVGYLIAFGGMLALAALRAGIGSTGRWRLLGLTIALPALIGGPAVVGLTSLGLSSQLAYAVVVPYGLAWLVVGLMLALRGSPTIADPPVIAIEPEVTVA
jgi:hypothetical protein